MKVKAKPSKLQAPAGGCSMAAHRDTPSSHDMTTGFPRPYVISRPLTSGAEMLPSGGGASLPPLHRRSRRQMRSQSLQSLPAMVEIYLPTPPPTNPVMSPSSRTRLQLGPRRPTPVRTEYFFLGGGSFVSVSPARQQDGPWPLPRRSPQLFCSRRSAATIAEDSDWTLRQ